MTNRAATSTSRWLDYLVWTVALWASLLNLLNFHNYPFFKVEVGLALLGLAVIGTAMGIVQRTARPRLSFLFIALFAVLTIDLNTSLPMHWLYALWVGLTIAAFFAQDILLKLTLAAFGAVLLFQFLTMSTGIGKRVQHGNMAQTLQAKSRFLSTRPAIVHLVVDSHLGLDGMALGPDAYRTLRAEQVAFFTKRGFQLYPRAYSRHSSTMESLPYLFSYGLNSSDVHIVDNQYAVPEQLPYFADLDSFGYKISAVLPNYVDLCIKQRMTHCRTFHNSALTSMLETNMGGFDRAKVFAFTLLRLATWPSSVARAFQRELNDFFGTEGRLPHNRNQIFPLASIEQLDRFSNELTDLRSGEARFGHFLLPHDPYVLNADCRVKPEAAWLDEHGPGAEAARELSYADHVRCLQRRIDRLLDVLDRTKAGREAIVLIHGDHGSRISRGQPFVGGPELSRREMLMSYSTLFAIRIPGEQAGEIPGTYALDELMADFRARDFASAPRPRVTPAEVLIKNPKVPSPQRKSLPGFDPI